MASHVRTTIRYDGPTLSDHEMDVQDLAPALLALGDLIQIANRRFNGDAASIRVLVKADVEQKCFQIDLSLIQSLIDQAKDLFAEEHVKTALDIAKAVGIVGGTGASLFKLIKWLTKNPPKPGTELQVENKDGTVVIINGDGNTVHVSKDVYDLASDPAVVDRIKKVVRPLGRPGYESLEFFEGDTLVERVDREEARVISDAPLALIEPLTEEHSTITGPVRIKTPQYEGHAKWGVLWGGRTIEVTMPPEWVEAFQSNKIDAPPNTVLRVTMQQSVKTDGKGMAVGAPSYTVLNIEEVIHPPRQGNLFAGQSPA